MGIDPNHPAIRQAFEKGLIELPPEKAPGFVEKSTPKAKRTKPSSAIRLTMELGVECPSTANLRDWRLRDKAARKQRLAVRRFFQDRPACLLPFVQAVAAGKLVTISLTRVGGRSLDNRDNLRMALKPVVDEVHVWFGLDDRSDTLIVEYAQEPGKLVGIRIELETA
jgi:hypothetical protein